MFQSLLFPTDFSPFNERLARCLPDLKTLGIDEIVFLNVVELGPQIGFASDTFEQMLEWKTDAEPRLAALRSQAVRAGLRARCRLELGKPALEIVRVAQEERISLIAMGSHGHGFIRGMLLGSVTHDVVRYANIPVLVLKLGVVEHPATSDCDSACQQIFRRVLLPTDFSEGAADALYLLKNMRAAGLKEVLLLHVREDNSGDEQSQKQLGLIRDELRYFGFEVTMLIAAGNPNRIIEQTARERDVSLIVIGAKGKSAAADDLLGTVSDEVVSRHVRPVLVARSRSLASAA